MAGEPDKRSFPLCEAKPAQLWGCGYWEAGLGGGRGTMGEVTETNKNIEVGWGVIWWRLSLGCRADVCA